MADVIEKSQIYDSRTLSYMEEVLSSYNQGNYRSAIVMLYSVVLCDLIFKLQELRDVFADKFAKSLLKKVDEEITKDKSSSAWEGIMINELHKNSPILESDTYALVLHLRDWRNLSAHPVLDDYSQLFTPEPHIVEGYICESFNKILSRPSIFVKDVVSVMSEDLDLKKGYILSDRKGFNDYLDNKYFRRMSDAMFTKVFKSFWKFTFILNNTDCDNNRLVNFNLLRQMVNKRPCIIYHALDSTPFDFEISDEEKTVRYAIAFLTYNPLIWDHLSEQTKSLIKKRVNQESFYKLIAWFLCEDKALYLSELIKEGFQYCPDETEIKHILSLYKNEGIESVLYDYFIHLLNQSTSFHTAQKRMDELILPYLNDMNKEQLDSLLNVFNSNSQLYHNYSYNSYCRKVTEKALEHFTQDIIHQKYPRVFFPEEDSN